MNNYKIKVNDEAKSKEIQELFAQLEYIPFEINRVGMVATDNGKIYPDVIGNWDKYDGEELTLPQLRDLVVLHQNDVKDATLTDHDGSLRFIMTSDRDVYVYEGDGFKRRWLRSGTRPEELKPIQPEREQGLISGADALIAIGKGERVQYSFDDDQYWQADIANLKITDFGSGYFQFRLKPRTIKLELEIPVPFEPKLGETYYFITTSNSQGFDFTEFDDSDGDKIYMQLGAYKTVSDARKAVAALRGIKG